MHRRLCGIHQTVAVCGGVEVRRCVVVGVVVWGGVPIVARERVVEVAREFKIPQH